MRFCMVTTFYPPCNFGGDGIAIERLSRALVRRGHEVTVVHDVDTYRALGGRLPERLASEEQVDGVRVIRLRSRLGVVSPFLVHQLGRPILHRRRLRRLLAPGRFNVVHYHNVSLIGGPEILTWDTGSVTLYTAHEFWLVCPTHDLWRYRRENCDRRECLRCAASYRRPPQLWRHTGIIERGLDSIDVVIALSEFSREKHRTFGLRRKMTVLPNFLPDGAVAPAVPGEQPPSSRPYFFFAGRLLRIKGLDDVIPLFQEFPGADLIIAGEGAHREELVRLAGGASNVRFLGRLPLAALGPWFRHAQAVLLPSVCWEQFPMVLLEALAAGSPVIARRLGSLAEHVGAAGAGVLFDSPADLRVLLRRILDDPEYRQGLAARASSALAERWTESVVLPRYLELIQDAASRRGLDLPLPSVRAPVLAAD